MFFLGGDSIKNNTYNLASNIRELRHQKNLTQNELGNMVGVSNKLISCWERGTRTMDANQLVAVANALSIEPSEFFLPLDSTKR